MAFNGTEARLYVSWKDDVLNKYYMASVENFLIHRPDHYLEFQKYVLNIVDWGKGKRLQSIRNALDTLISKEERGKKGESQTKSQAQPPAKKSQAKKSQAKATQPRHPPPPPLDITSTSHKRPRLMDTAILSPMMTTPSPAPIISSPVSVSTSPPSHSPNPIVFNARVFLEHVIRMDQPW